MVLDLVSFRYIFKIRKVNERLNENETNPRVNYFEKKIWLVYKVAKDLKINVKCLLN